MLDDVRRVLGARVGGLEIVVADDGSTDGTPDLLRALARDVPGLRTVRHARNLGYGAAARAALSAATRELVLLTDADRQFELEGIDAFLEAIGEADMVVGFRAPRRDGAARVLAGRAWSALVNGACGYAARDVNCAFKLAWRDALALVLPALTSTGATFSAEWLLRSRRAGLRLAERPVGHRPRAAGVATGLRPGVMVRALVELARLRRDLERGRPCASP
jgi:glycosyltransferase involved in cell wall biosynthesis